MRKRINKNMLATSNNYELYKKIRINHIVEEHEKNKSKLETLVLKIPYVKCFGKLVKIPTDKIDFYKKLNIEIIYK